MKNTFQTLENAPIKVAIIQIKFNESVELDKILSYDPKVRIKFKNLQKNINANIDMPGTLVLGLSKVTANTNVTSYTYLSEDKKFKYIIDSNSITIIDERKYQTFDFFKSEAFEIIDIYDFMKGRNVNRLSIRYVNQFNFNNNEIENLSEYFNTTVSGNESLGFNYPVFNYAFKITLRISELEFAILNQSIERISDENNTYIFDIDVLDHNGFVFDKQLANMKLEKLRQIKDELFFGNISQKTKDLCN